MQPAFFNFYGAVLNAGQAREALIGNNIANADTPGYKAQDIDFSSTLSATLQDPAAAPVAAYRQDTPMGLDGNDVDVDSERIEAASNGEQMQGAATFLRQATADLITALRPNPSGD